MSALVFGLSAVSAGFGLSAGRKAAAEARRAGQRQAAEIIKQRFLVREIATQQHLNRSDQYAQTASYNRAAAAYMGRSDRSIAALRRREATLYGRDVERIRTQEEADVAKLYADAEGTIDRAKSQASAIKAQTYGSLLNTAITAAAIA